MAGRFQKIAVRCQMLKIANQANTYAYLTAKATQDLPARRNCTTALCLFAKALRADPWVLVRPGFKPWVVKALAKAVICLILPAPVVKKIAGTMEKRQGGLQKRSALNDL